MRVFIRVFIRVFVSVFVRVFVRVFVPVFFRVLINGYEARVAAILWFDRTGLLHILFVNHQIPPTRAKVLTTFTVGSKVRSKSLSQTRFESV